MFEFQHRSHTTSAIPNPQSKEIEWLPPACGGIKSNYDGATFDDSSEARIGVVVILDSDEVLAAPSEKIALPSSVVMLEALAARQVAQFVIELVLHHSVFEEDSEVVYKALTSDLSPWSNIDHIIKDILSVASSLRTHSFSHSRRHESCSCLN